MLHENAFESMMSRPVTVSIGGAGGVGWGGVGGGSINPTDIHKSHKHTTDNIKQFNMKINKPHAHSLTQSYTHIQYANN